MSFSVCIITWAVKRARREQQLKAQSGRPNIDDIEYSNKNLRSLLLAAFAGGVVNALGLGGGVIFNPLLFNLGMVPQAATATGMYMILFSSAATTLAFITFGGLPIQLALWIGLWSVLAIVISLRILAKFVQRTNKPSVVVFILGVVLAASAIMVPIYDVRNLLKAEAAGHAVWSFGKLCS